jgi:hypothetical protein
MSFPQASPATYEQSILYKNKYNALTILNLPLSIVCLCVELTLFLYIIGHSYPKFTVHNALSYYSIKHSDRQDLHVTACFSPRGKYLAGSPYHKSPAVGKALGEISQLSINGCVITNDTFSARVSLTKKQRALWMNDDQTGQQQRKRGTVKQIKFEQYWTPVCCY